ncbi:hypothetical protein BGZ96_004039, partial [Linnemannia gamsii]
MVYATRSRVINKNTPTTTTHTTREPISTKHISVALSKKTPSAISKKSNSTTTTIATLTHPISIKDGRRGHSKDGKLHHIIEEDGQDRHHIWYHDFSENEALAHNNNNHNHKPAQPSRSRSDRRESLHSEVGGATAHRVRNLSRRDVAAALYKGTPASHGAVPKTHVDHHHIRYVSDDDSSAMDVDRDTQRLATLSNRSGGSSDEGAHHALHRRGSQSGTSRTSKSTIVTRRSSKSSPGKATSHTETTQSSTPMQFVVQEQSLHLQKDLEEANKQRTRLIIQIREISESLKEKETNLMGAHSTIKGLEYSNRTHAEETERLADELRLLKQRLASHEHELQGCHSKIKILEGAQEKVHTLNLHIKELRDQISEHDATIKDLEKDNKALNIQSLRADNIMDDMRILKEDLVDREGQLSKALETVNSLTIYKERALALEDEVNDLSDQVNVQEKHLTYLEDALMAHENCAYETKQLQDEIDMLEDLLHEKEDEVSKLQTANKGLAIKDTKIETLQKEIQTILHEMEAKGKATLKLQEKTDHALAQVSSTASTLRTEVEGLRQELEDKNHELKHTHKMIDELKDEKDRNMHLTIEITKLEKIIADKDRRANDLDKIVESMKAHADRLEGEVKELQREVRHGEKAANQVSKDLAAVSSTANTLRVEVESLREQLHEREKELSRADKIAKDLQQKTRQVKELLTKINGLETSQQHYVLRTHKAEDKSKGLGTDITVLEARIGGLQHQLKEKKTGLQAALDKVNEDYDSALLRLEESRIVVANLKKQLKETEKDSHHQLWAKDDQIHVLKNEIKEWENHEEGWVNKTTDLTLEIERGTDLIRHKDKAIHDLKYKLGEHNTEIGRLNEAINQARDELHESRKRRASEIENEVTEKTHHFLQDKTVLKKTISDLEHNVKHLQKKIRLDHDHALLERQLGEQIRELTLWKQNSIEQTKEWETTVANLEREKELQVGMLTRYERQIHTLQTQVEGADAWRLKAIEQAEKLTAMISRLEKELHILKGTLAQHDSNDTKLNDKVHSMTLQIETLEMSRDELHREVRAKDTQIAELEERLRGEISSYKARLADTRRELVVNDKKIDVLNARIGELTREMADLESRVAQDKDSMAAMESTLDRLRHTLATQMDTYKILDNKYQAALSTQVDQDKQLYKLEKTLDRVMAEDTEKVKALESKDRHLEKELDRAFKRVNNLQMELHSVTRQYRDTLDSLEDAKFKMAKMVPTEQASHEACAARIHSGEKEVSKLSSKIVDLKSQVD